MSTLVKPTKPQNASQKGGNGFVITGIIILIVVAAAVTGAYYFYYLPSQKKPAPAPPVVEKVDTVPIVQEPIEMDTEPASAAETAAVRFDSDPDIEKGFYIVIGSYQNKRNAERFAKNMKADIETKVLYFKGSGLYRVTCGHYKNIHTAYNDRISVLDLEGCGAAWIGDNR
jgi:cell division protein FtsN